MDLSCVFFQLHLLHVLAAADTAIRPHCRKAPADWDASDCIVRGRITGLSASQKAERDFPQDAVMTLNLPIVHPTGLRHSEVSRNSSPNQLPERLASAQDLFPFARPPLPRILSRGCHPSKSGGFEFPLL